MPTYKKRAKKSKYKKSNKFAISLVIVIILSIMFLLSLIDKKSKSKKVKKETITITTPMSSSAKNNAKSSEGVINSPTSHIQNDLNLLIIDGVKYVSPLTRHRHFIGLKSCKVKNKEFYIFNPTSHIKNRLQICPELSTLVSKELAPSIEEFIKNIGQISWSKNQGCMNNKTFLIVNNGKMLKSINKNTWETRALKGNEGGVVLCKIINQK
jgi:hypothetical protein